MSCSLSDVDTHISFRCAEPDLSDTLQVQHNLHPKSWSQKYCHSESQALLDSAKLFNAVTRYVNSVQPTAQKKKCRNWALRICQEKLLISFNYGLKIKILLKLFFLLSSFYHIYIFNLLLLLSWQNLEYTALLRAIGEQEKNSQRLCLSQQTHPITLKRHSMGIFFQTADLNTTLSHKFLRD